MDDIPARLPGESIERAALYRAKAAEARGLARDAHSFEVRLSFLKISEGYRHLAALAEDMARKWQADSQQRSRG